MSPRFRFAAAVALLACAAPVRADGAVRVDLDPPHLLAGDRVTALLAAPCSAQGAQPTFPDWSRGWGKAEVISAGPVTIEERDGQCAALQRLQITAFEVGTIALPSVSVRMSDGSELRTPEGLALEVRSVIAPDDQELAPAPPAPPRRQPVPRSVWVALATGVALAGLAGIVAWRRRYGTDALAAPSLPPFAELERALGKLAGYAADEAFRGLSTAFRRFLGRAFEFHALESTSTEVSRRLAERNVPRELVQRATAALRLADQVKFARRPARADEAAQRIGDVRAIGAEIEAMLAPPPAVEAGSKPEKIA
jgi:hypothetical protein